MSRRSFNDYSRASNVSSSRGPLLLVALTVAGCANTSTWTPPPIPVTDATGTAVLLGSVVGAPDKERAKIQSARDLLNRVLLSPKFWSTVEAGPALADVRDAMTKAASADNLAQTTIAPDQTFAWNRVSTPNAIGPSRPLTNHEVAEVLRAAIEPGGHIPGVVELSVRRNNRPLAFWCGWPFYNEIGHREQPNIVVTQDCYMERMTSAELAGHWLHEYLHMIGFDHAYHDDALRPYSVPYFVGTIAVQLACELNEQPCKTGEARGE